MRLCEHQKIMQEIHQANSLNLGNLRINFLYRWGIVTLLRSHSFQALASSTTLSQSTWHQARNQALVVHPKDIRVMGDHAKDMTSPKEYMVDLK
jgi:hypothetical protein